MSDLGDPTSSCAQLHLLNTQPSERSVDDLLREEEQRAADVREASKEQVTTAITRGGVFWP